MASSVVAQQKQNRREQRTFLSDVIVRVIAQAFSGLKGLIYIPILAKQLTTVEYGIWTQVLTLSILLVPIFTVRLETAAVRYLAGESDKGKVGQMISTML